MSRREFITLLGGAAAAWPWIAGAQNGTRRIGVLVAPDSSHYIPLFVETLGKLRWIEGQNVHIDYRTWNADPERKRTAAADLIVLRAVVILAPGLSFLVACWNTQPIAFVTAC